jgi:4-phospho-D-threonate 3-dehydrogenase / 4-phospho-D-erythronate 3-dehydrogenase
MTEARPILAVTMGDPAGIGPEIAVRALLSPEVREISRSFLIGDARVFERALKVCGLAATLNRIAGPEDIADRAGVIDVVHQQTVDPDMLPMGKVQALGGEAAYAAIRASIAGLIASISSRPNSPSSPPCGLSAATARCGASMPS